MVELIASGKVAISTGNIERLNEIIDNCETAKNDMSRSMQLFDHIHPKKEPSELQEPTSASNTFFLGCDTKEKAEKRYKALSKAFHPDGACGNEDMFKRMKEEYEGLSF